MSADRLEAAKLPFVPPSPRHALSKARALCLEFPALSFERARDVTARALGFDDWDTVESAASRLDPGEPDEHLDSHQVAGRRAHQVATLVNFAGLPAGRVMAYLRTWNLTGATALAHLGSMAQDQPSLEEVITAARHRPAPAAANGATGRRSSVLTKRAGHEWQRRCYLKYVEIAPAFPALSQPGQTTPSAEGEALERCGWSDRAVAQGLAQWDDQALARTDLTGAHLELGWRSWAYGLVFEIAFPLQIADAVAISPIQQALIQDAVRQTLNFDGVVTISDVAAVITPGQGSRLAVGLLQRLLNNQAGLADLPRLPPASGTPARVFLMIGVTLMGDPETSQDESEQLGRLRALSRRLHIPGMSRATAPLVQVSHRLDALNFATLADAQEKIDFVVQAAKRGSAAGLGLVKLARVLPVAPGDVTFGIRMSVPDTVFVTTFAAGYDSVRVLGHLLSLLEAQRISVVIEDDVNPISWCRWLENEKQPYRYVGHCFSLLLQDDLGVAPYSASPFANAWLRMKHKWPDAFPSLQAACLNSNVACHRYSAFLKEHLSRAAGSSLRQSAARVYSIALQVEVTHVAPWVALPSAAIDRISTMLARAFRLHGAVTTSRRGLTSMMVPTPYMSEALFYDAKRGAEFGPAQFEVRAADPFDDLAPAATEGFTLPVPAPGFLLVFFAVEGSDIQLIEDTALPRGMISWPEFTELAPFDGVQPARQSLGVVHRPFDALARFQAIGMASLTEVMALLRRPGPAEAHLDIKPRETSERSQVFEITVTCKYLDDSVASVTIDSRAPAVVFQFVHDCLEPRSVVPTLTYLPG